MADLEFSKDELLEQARGNLTAIWYATARWARERDGSAEGWASFVGREFAPSWDELGGNASALHVARLAALNMATTADIRPVELTGDQARAELVLEGPDQEFLEGSGVTRDEIDLTNELIFREIAERRGLTLVTRRDDARWHLLFSRS